MEHSVKVCWYKKLLSNTIMFYKGKSQTGFMNVSSFSGTCHAALNGEAYTFLREGVLGTTYKVYSKQTSELVATVILGALGNKATVYLTSGERWTWHSPTFFGREWKMLDQNKTAIAQSTFSLSDRGYAYSNTTEMLAMLTGSFLDFHFHCNTAVFTSIVVVVIVICIL